ncbi:hypothetical protein HHK36_018928 [Tetracentron sinense]|uniref:DUF6598 domain-containing protein n=1 Tax=Tetracentron sinense TaxID=13715 RepID=A0A834YT05_TETSI|nr:hypothetical protein HHK36_018928 [Tetracentron sinense]
MVADGYGTRFQKMEAEIRYLNEGHTEHTNILTEILKKLTNLEARHNHEESRASQDDDANDNCHQILDHLRIQTPTLHLDFPCFNGEDPKGWIYTVEQFQRFNQISDDKMVKLASLHLSEDAIPWYRWMEKIMPTISWPQFVEDVCIRFGPPASEDPCGALSKLHQTVSFGPGHKCKGQFAILEGFELDDDVDVHHKPSDEMEPESSVRVSRNQGYYGKCLRPLIEMFSVRIMNFTGNIYGTIRIQDPLNSQYIYNRKLEESEPISPPNNDLVISGPDQAISAYGDLVVFVDLMDKDSDLPLVSRGLMVWSFASTIFNEPFSDVVQGNYGSGFASDSVRVNYIVFKDAVEAGVKVTLIVGDGEDPSHVYGRITAGNSDFAEESVLFRKRSEEHIDVRSGQLIPLSKFLVAVPLNSILIVRADLWNYNNAISSNAIAKGNAEFPAKFCDTFEKRICGQCCEIRVEVTFGTDVYDQSQSDFWI